MRSLRRKFFNSIKMYFRRYVYLAITVRRYSYDMFLDWKTQYHQDVNSPQTDL